MLSRPRARALPCALGALTIWLALAGRATAQPAVSVSPATLTFPGVQRVGTPASPREVVINNAPGAADLTYSATTSSAEATSMRSAASMMRIRSLRSKT